MKNFVKMVLKYHYTFIVMALFILIMGIVTIFKTPIDIFPEIDTPVVTAVWTYTGMQAKDIERRLLLLLNVLMHRMLTVSKELNLNLCWELE